MYQIEFPILDLHVNEFLFQVFAYTKRQQVMSDDNCLDATGQTSPVKLVRCHGMGGNQAWNYNEEVIIIMTQLQWGAGVGGEIS